MSSASVDTPGAGHSIARPASFPRIRVLSGTRVAYHALGIAPIVLFALWLTRRWLFRAALPAGTDMLGFVARAAENRSLDQAISLWNPASWGARRGLTLESLLGLAARVTGDPVLTVKLVSLGVLISTGVCAYALTWRLFRSRVAATTSGVLYMSSQGSLAHWASGHLNVELGIAFAPLLLLLWIEGVERFRPANACCLALTAAAIAVGRPDLLLYPIPFMVLYVCVRLAFVSGARSTLKNAFLTGTFSAVGTLALSSYLIVPAVAGIRPQWLTSQSLFDTRQLVDRSVGAYESTLGFAREIGYLAFTDQQTWTYHPWLPYAEYVACSTAVVVLAYSALATRRDHRTVFFAAMAVLAGFLGKGLRPPLGGPYLWAVTHVPIFGNLRDPNRWLIAEGLAYSVLAGVTVAWIQCRRPWWHAVRFVLLPTLVCAALLPVAPTLLGGFRTVSILPSQSRLTARIAADPQPSIVTSVPFDQTYRFVRQPGYRGWEHDLGSESAAFSGHPAIGDGGWDQQAADTVAFTSTLLKRGDPAFTRILGSLGSKYLLDLGYPATDPHLLVGGSGPRSQQRAVAAMAGLSRVTSNAGGRLYRIGSFASVVSFRPNIALVLGGRDGIAALADSPRIDLRTWAVFTADDVLAQEGTGGCSSSRARPTSSSSTTRPRTTSPSWPILRSRRCRGSRAIPASIGGPRSSPPMRASVSAASRASPSLLLRSTGTRRRRRSGSDGRACSNSGRVRGAVPTRPVSSSASTTVLFVR